MTCIWVSFPAVRSRELGKRHCIAGLHHTHCFHFRVFSFAERQIKHSLVQHSTSRQGVSPFYTCSFLKGTGQEIVTCKNITTVLNLHIDWQVRIANWSLYANKETYSIDQAYSNPGPHGPSTAVFPAFLYPGVKCEVTLANQLH